MTSRGNRSDDTDNAVATIPPEDEWNEFRYTSKRRHIDRWLANDGAAIDKFFRAGLDGLARQMATSLDNLNLQKPS